MSKKFEVSESMSDFNYHLITSSDVYSIPYSLLAREAESAGIHYFHLREKQWPVRQLLTMADEIRRNLNKTKFIVNGSLDVAVAAGADGVHLQRENIPVAGIRRKFPDLIIGYSAHSREELLRVEEDGADYAFLSPIFSPLSAIKGLPPLGLRDAAKWIAGIELPVIALGGIVTDALREVQHAGFAGAAGISLFCKEGRFFAGGMVI